MAEYFWKVILPVAILVAICWYFYTKLRQPELYSGLITIRWQWLCLAALLYLTAHTLWASYWVILLRNQGATVKWITGIRSYFISQMGKYVPGKVWVIVLRVGMLGNSLGISRTAVGITATYEAFVSMAAGAFVGALLLSTLAPEQMGLEGISIYWVIPLGMIPIGLVGLNRFINRVSRWRKGPNAPQLPRVKLHMVIFGILMGSLGWFIMGASLWCVVKGIIPQASLMSWDQVGHFTSINAIAYVIGFMAFFMPAGSGVREFAMQKLLTLELAPIMATNQATAIAVVLAIVLRLTWTVAELLCAGCLYWFVPGPGISKELTATVQSA
ncbi:MAG: lysylphosphatidylglycerol synthase transmembrane domain-containing protein [Zavarzinella sp.]